MPFRTWSLMSWTWREPEAARSTVQEIQKLIVKHRQEVNREVQDLLWQAKEDHTLMAGPGALTDKESKQKKEQAKKKLYEQYGITVRDENGNVEQEKILASDFRDSAKKDWVKVERGSKLGEYEVNGDKRTLRAGLVIGDIKKNKNFVRMGPKSMLEINDSGKKESSNYTLTLRNSKKNKNLNVEFCKRRGISTNETFLLEMFSDIFLFQ